LYLEGNGSVWKRWGTVKRGYKDAGIVKITLTCDRVTAHARDL